MEVRYGELRLTFKLGDPSQGGSGDEVICFISDDNTDEEAGWETNQWRVENPKRAMNDW